MSLCLADGLGSIRQIVDVTGTVIENYDYDPYGKPSVVSAVGNPIMFAGRWLDKETGNYYYRARQYSPLTGRFLQRDPIGYWDSMNLYGCTVNNPINYIDPYGENWMLWGGRAIGGFLRSRCPAILSGGKRLWDWLKKLPKKDPKNNGKPEEPDVCPLKQPKKDGEPISPMDMKDPSTWPKPPVDGPLTPGVPSRLKPAQRGEKSLYDQNGGEWRPHLPDNYHNEPHWNYKPPGEKTPWQDVPM